MVGDVSVGHFGTDDVWVRGKSYVGWDGEGDVVCDAGVVISVIVS